MLNQKISDELINNLIAQAKCAANNAYAPFSKFKVGAALMTKSGKVYTGCNIENSSYGLTICAERVAIFKAISEGEREFIAMAIYNKEEKPYPCGACRQVMFEFNGGDMLVIIATDHSKDVLTLADLLPKGFKLAKTNC
mgnify:CR=1 FL=1